MQLIVPIDDASSDTTTNTSRSIICIEQQQREIGRRTATGAVGINADQSINNRNPVFNGIGDRNNDNNYNGDSILSDDLRGQFETMKSVWRQARRGNDNGDGSSFSHANDDTATKQRQARIRKELKRKEREAARETAIKIDNEISQWRNGIADLEALLAAEGEEQILGDNDNHGPPGIREITFVARSSNNNNNHNNQHQPHQQQQIPPRFPFLPPTIPSEDDDVND